MPLIYRQIWFPDYFASMTCHSIEIGVRSHIQNRIVPTDASVLKPMKLKTTQNNFVK